MNWMYKELADVLVFVKDRTVKEVTCGIDSQTATFSDGTKLRITSEYEGDYSDLTPGNGIEPPRFEIYR